MAIADTITSMQTHTSNAYTMIGYATDLTGINKNLANLKQCIFDSLINSMSDTLNPTWNNLPKIATTPATSLSINNTIKAPMRIELGASELTQAGTPTPSSPQDIHTIKGNNTIRVEWKNLIPYTNQDFTISGLRFYCQNGNFYLNGTATEVSSLNTNFKNYFNFILDAGTYTLDRHETTRPVYLRKYSDDSIIKESAGTFTLNEKTKIYIGLYVSGSSGTYNNVQLPIEIHKGSTTIPYTPYVSQEADIDLDTLEYCKIGNYEDKFIRNSGKNKLDTTNWTGAYITSNGSITTDNDKINALFDGYIKVEPNTSYTFSANKTLSNMAISEFNSSKTFIQRNSQYNISSKTITTTATTEYVRIGFNYDSATTITQTIINNIELMFNDGNSRLPYEPYGTNEWYIKKNIGKVVLDGTENWTINSGGDYSSNPYFSANISGMPSGNYHTTLLSNYFVGKNISTTTTNAIQHAVQILLIQPTELNLSSADDFKTWLSSHNTEVWYPLATPTYTKITGTLAEQLENVYQKLLSYTGQTNISQVNNDLSFVINASALEELS